MCSRIESSTRLLLLTSSEENQSSNQTGVIDMGELEDYEHDSTKYLQEDVIF